MIREYIYVVISALIGAILGAWINCAYGQVGQVGIGSPFVTNESVENTVSDSTKFKIEDSGATITPKSADSLRIVKKIIMGNDDGSITINSAMERLELMAAGSTTVIDLWPGKSSGNALGTIYNGSDTLYHTGLDVWADSLLLTSIGVQNPANILQTQVFTIASVDSLYFVLSSTWTGSDLTGTAIITPYGWQFFDILNAPYIREFARNDSSGFKYTKNEKVY